MGSQPVSPYPHSCLHPRGVQSFRAVPLHADRLHLHSSGRVTRGEGLAQIARHVVDTRYAASMYGYTGDTMSTHCGNEVAAQGGGCVECVRVHSLNNVPYLTWNLESRYVLTAYLR